MAKRGLLTIALAALAFLIAIPPDFGHAQQQPQPRRGFFEMLFGPRVTQPRPPPQMLGQPPAPPQQQRQQQQRSAPAEPPVAVVQTVPKDENARKILVIGDFVAAGLAWGLDQTFAEESGIVVMDRANSASGLVREDYYDWNGQLLSILNDEKPDIVVVAIGSNDRQQIRLGNERLAPRSDAWEKAYTERIAAMADTLKVYGRPFFWMGVPPMRQQSAMRDMLHFNDLYRAGVTAAGGYFVDIWGGFTNEDGRFISSGPDVAGQLRALRSGDGINFTRAGRLKLAFYVEREIKRHTGLGTGTVDLMASVEQQSQIEIGPDGEKRLVGPVISLTDPLPGPGSNALAGGPDAEAPKDGETPAQLMIVKGEALPPVSGRADDFAWPPRTGAAAAAAPADAGTAGP